MPFIALKPCNFAGRAFKKGSVIPDRLVDGDMVRKLVSAGKIRKQEKAITQSKRGKSS